jgi:hypothetical protein
LGEPSDNNKVEKEKSDGEEKSTHTYTHREKMVIKNHLQFMKKNISFG